MVVPKPHLKLLPVCVALFSVALYKFVPSEIKNGVQYFFTHPQHPHPLARIHDDRLYAFIRPPPPATSSSTSSSEHDFYSPRPSSVDTDVLFVITGASSGIGLSTAKELLRVGVAPSRVVLAVRNVGKMKTQWQTAAAEEPAMPRILPLDLASLKTVQEAAKTLRKWCKEEKKAIVLVNNAGIAWQEQKTLTADGFESQFQTNHLGHYLLTRLLLDFEEAAGTNKSHKTVKHEKVLRRVVHLSSIAHAFGHLPGFVDSEKSPWERLIADFVAKAGTSTGKSANSTSAAEEQMQKEKKKQRGASENKTKTNMQLDGQHFHWRTYMDTKFMNNLFSNALVRRLGVHSVLVHPGVVYTNLARVATARIAGEPFGASLFQWLGRGLELLQDVLRSAMVSADEAARNCVLYAMFELRPVIAPHYVANMNIVEQIPAAHSVAQQDFLWNESERMVKKWLAL
eukprot:g15076.t1